MNELYQINAYDITGYVGRAVRSKISCEICIEDINKLRLYDKLHLIKAKDWEGDCGRLTKSKVVIVNICNNRK